MNPRNIWLIARKEMRDSLRNRWFILDAIAFAVLTVAMSYLSLMGSGLGGFAGFGRTTAALVNLVLLVVPLMALTVGAGGFAAERERGTLAYLLAQPLTRSEILFGKYIGLSIALLAALAGGFAIGALVIALHGTPGGVAPFIMLVGLTFVLCMSMLSVGVLISVISNRSSVALGAAIILWLSMVFLCDLGLMGSTVIFKLQASQIFQLALINPLQVFKMAVLSSLHTSLDVLGPAGLYASDSYGAWLGLIFTGCLALWVAIPLAAAWAAFTRRAAL
ncbi:MAG: ABC transporter permease [Phycisphaerales bacterium]